MPRSFSSFFPVEMKASLRLIVSHGDCVSTLPGGAQRIAYSDSCENEAYIAGANANMLAIQSHPEFDLHYCITERIWPAVVEKNKRLTEEQVDVARESFSQYDPADALVMLKFIENFLHQET